MFNSVSVAYKIGAAKSRYKTLNFWKNECDKHALFPMLFCIILFVKFQQVCESCSSYCGDNEYRFVLV